MSNRRVTIVMYHFVRDLPRTRYPAIKGLTTAKFIGQLDYMSVRYNFVSVEDCLRALAENEPLPENAALLTFDDGYSDHFTTVFPLLDARRIRGAFFPPARAITHHEVLDVNKIHFLLATADADEVKSYLLRSLDEFRAEYGLEDTASYVERLHVPNRFDPANVNFIKRLLQRELPESLRKRLTHDLFSKYVAADEGAFARELYMDAEQLRCMIRHGMYVGSHGSGHFWMNTLTEADQSREIELSLDFLETLGAPTKDWVMCYPYGAHNSALVDTVRAHNGAIGLTTEPSVAELSADFALTLPRLDTNDLPQPETACS